jgi:Uma2 family endonuclease
MAQALLEEPPLELPRHKFTVDDLDRMLEAGILDKDDKVELLEGEFIVMSAMGDPHHWVVRRLNRLLVPAIGDRAWVNVGLPVRSSRYSEPEPDVSVQPAPALGKSPKIPTPHLVIEVSDSSLKKDRTLKQRIYSSAGVPEYWIVNLVDFQIEVHTDPRDARYANRVIHPRDATLRIGAFPDVEVRFAEILADL